MQLFKLFGSVMVDNKKANQSLQKTDSLAKKLGKGLGKGIKTAAKWGAALTAGAAAGGTALLGVVNKSAETADRVDKLSQKVLMSRKGFQEWDHIMNQSGVSIESMQGGMKKLNKMMTDGVSGNKKAVATFKELGFSMSELKKMSPEQAFEKAVKALQKMPEGAKKAQLANELFGRSGSELAPILNATSEDIEQLRKDAHDLGLVMSDEAVDAGVLFGDTMADVKDALGMAFVDIGTEVMPLLQKFADWLKGNMPAIKQIIRNVFSKIKDYVKGAVDVFNKYLLPVFQAIYDWVQKNWPTIKQIISDAIDGAKLAFDKLIDVGGQLIDALEPVFNFFKDVVIYITNFKDETNLTLPILGGLVAGFVAFKTALAISALITTVTNGIKAFTIATEGQTIAQGLLNAVMAVNPFTWIAIAIGLLVAAGIALWKNWDTVVAKAKELGANLSEIWNGIKAKVVEVWTAIKNFISNTWNSIKTTISNTVNSVKTTVSNVFNSIKNTVTNIWNGIKNTTSNVWNGIKTTVSNVVNGVKNTVSNVFNSIKNTVTNIWNGIKTAITTPIESAKNIISGIINRIKGLFNFKFKWPKIPMPSFKLEGSLNPIKWVTQGLPKLKIKWNAKGAIFDKPTIFNTPRGLQGVGEAGPEAVTPISKLQDMIDWNRSDYSGIEQKLDTMIELLSLILGKDINTYLDSRKMSKQLAPHIDNELARLKGRRAI